MSFLDAILLGMIQGLTEFLPISSSGHLVVAQHFLGIKENQLTFDVAIHFGTLLSVLFVYKDVVLQILLENLAYARTKQVTPAVKLLAMVLIGTVPAAIVGLGFKHQIELLFTNLNVVIGGFMVTGTLLILTQFKARGQMGGHFVEKFSNAEKINMKSAWIVGITQAVAITPGISRSGSTIAAGILTGMDRATSALFSFMLAIPAILGAAILQLRHLEALSAQDLAVFAAGTVTSFIFGIISLKVVLSFIREGRLHYFGYYVWALAAFLVFKTA